MANWKLIRNGNVLAENTSGSFDIPANTSPSNISYTVRYTDNAGNIADQAYTVYAGSECQPSPNTCYHTFQVSGNDSIILLYKNQYTTNLPSVLSGTTNECAHLTTEYGSVKADGYLQFTIESTNFHATHHVYRLNSNGYLQEMGYPQGTYGCEDCNYVVVYCQSIRTEGNTHVINVATDEDYTPSYSEYVACQQHECGCNELVIGNARTSYTSASGADTVNCAFNDEFCVGTIGVTSSESSWLHASYKNGYISVLVDANNGSARSGTITPTVNSVPCTALAFTISQEAKPTPACTCGDFSASKNSVSFGSGADSSTVTFSKTGECTGNLTSLTPSTNDSWITPTFNSSHDTLTISVSANTDTTMGRTGYTIVSYDGNPCNDLTITVEQSQATPGACTCSDLSVGSSPAAIAATGGSAVVTWEFTGSCASVLVTPSVPTEATWCHVTTGNGVFNITVDNYSYSSDVTDRSATITPLLGESRVPCLSGEFTVTQSAPEPPTPTVAYYLYGNFEVSCDGYNPNVQEMEQRLPYSAFTSNGTFISASTTEDTVDMGYPYIIGCYDGVDARIIRNSVTGATLDDAVPGIVQLTGSCDCSYAITYRLNYTSTSITATIVSIAGNANFDQSEMSRTIRITPTSDDIGEACANCNILDIPLVDILNWKVNDVIYECRESSMCLYTGLTITNDIDHLSIIQEAPTPTCEMSSRTYIYKVDGFKNLNDFEITCSDAGFRLDEICCERGAYTPLEPFRGGFQFSVNDDQDVSSDKFRAWFNINDDTFDTDNTIPKSSGGFESGVTYNFVRSEDCEDNIFKTILFPSSIDFFKGGNKIQLVKDSQEGEDTNVAEIVYKGGGYTLTITVSMSTMYLFSVDLKQP